jgi:hypothetical protein
MVERQGRNAGRASPTWAGPAEALTRFCGLFTGPRPVRARRKLSAAVAALLLGVSAAATLDISSARAQGPITAPMQGKKWSAKLVQMMSPLPYVQVMGVLDANKPADLPKVTWYYVLPRQHWWVDCKYYHARMGWMYRGSEVEGVTDSGGPSNGYYEVGRMSTILMDGLTLEDVTDICFPGGDEVPQ